MNSCDVVGYTFEGCRYCPDCAPSEWTGKRTPDEIGVQFADDLQGDDYCGDCHHSLACVAGLSSPICEKCFPSERKNTRKARKSLPEEQRIALSNAVQCGAKFRIFIQRGCVSRATVDGYRLPDGVQKELRSARFEEIGTGQFQWIEGA